MMKSNNQIQLPILDFHNNQFEYKMGRIVKAKGEEVFMEHRLKELFYILLSNKNEVVSREDLMAFVWKDIIVNEESITKAVSDLRKFFVKNGFENIKIVTIRKLGYKLELEEKKKPWMLKNTFAGLVLKGLMYTILFFAVVIILIRAIRY